MNEAYRITGIPTLFPMRAAVTAPEFMAREPVERAAVGGRWLGGLRQAVERWRRRERGRPGLARLDDRVLRDLGLRGADLGAGLEAPFQGLGEPLARTRGGGLWPL